MTTRALPDILLICLDAVRTGAVLGGDDRFPAPPYLASLAARGLLFAECYTAAPWTLPSFATLFTGLYPSEHGADRYQAYFAPAMATLAEQMAGSYQTVCVSQNPYLTYRFNLTQGFDRSYAFGRFMPSFYARRTRHLGWRKYLELMRLVLAGSHVASNLADTQQLVATAWRSRRQADHGAARNNEIIRKLFASHRGRPLFVLANYMEAHWPYYYDPQAGFLAAEDASHILNRLQATFPFQLITGTDTLSAAERDALAALYATAVHYLDRMVRALVESLAREGVGDNLWIIVFADHGELLGENNLYAHTLTLHNRVLHVPLLVVPPRGELRPRVIRQRFRLHDLRELLLRLTSGGPPAVERYLSEYPKSQLIYAEYVADQDRLTPTDRCKLVHLGLDASQVALIRGRHKLVRRSDGREQLHDVSADPDEESNLIDSLPDVASDLRAELEQFRNRLAWPSRSLTVPDEAVEDRLRALGYF